MRAAVILFLRLLAIVLVGVITIFSMNIADLIRGGIFANFPPPRPLQLITHEFGLIPWLPVLLTAASIRFRTTLILGAVGFLSFLFLTLSMEWTLGRIYSADDLPHLLAQAASIAIFFFLSLLGLVGLTRSVVTLSNSRSIEGASRSDVPT